MKPCIKGWDDSEHNAEGRCCCNCIYQRPLAKHPWNDGVFKGSCSEQVETPEGDLMWVCLVNTDEAMSMSREHSMCEMHTFKE